MSAPAGYSTATLRDFVGHDFGAPAPVTVGQPRIDGFAEVTGDHQWIHVDVERARAESPFGSGRPWLPDAVADGGGSAAPRPWRRPSRHVSANDGTVQSCPSTGTTSVCPESVTPGRSAGPIVA